MRSFACSRLRISARSERSIWISAKSKTIWSPTCLRAQRLTRLDGPWQPALERRKCRVKPDMRTEPVKTRKTIGSDDRWAIGSRRAAVGGPEPEGDKNGRESKCRSGRGVGWGRVAQFQPAGKA